MTLSCYGTLEIVGVIIINIVTIKHAAVLVSRSFTWLMRSKAMPY